MAAGIETFSMSGSELKEGISAGRIGHVKIRLNHANITKLLKSAPIANDLNSRADRIRAALPVSNGEEWLVKNGYSKDRAWSMVIATNAAARRAAAEGALHRAVDSGR